MKKYDIALIESDGCLTKDSYSTLADMVDGERMIPIEIEAAHAECSAMGFISEDAADQLDFDYDGLRKYLGRIMDDINLENSEYTYKYEGLSIYMGYEKILQEEKENARNSSDDREVNVTALPYAVQEGTIQVPANIIGEENVKQYIFEHWDEVSLGEVSLDYKGADFDIYDELEEEKGLE